MHCCTGNATRTLYYIYESMLEEKEGQPQVKLLLHRAAATADVYSYLPQEGKVVLKINQPLQRGGCGCRSGSRPAVGRCSARSTGSRVRSPGRSSISTWARPNRGSTWP